MSGWRWASRSSVAAYFVALAAWVLLWAAPLARASVTSSAAAPLRVLIVGNSYTRFNVLTHLIQRLSASVVGGQRLVVEAEARSGFSLATHLRAGQALPRIATGHYAYVVLQAHSLSAVDHPAELGRDVERFKRVIDAVHAHTVLCETWPRHPSARLYRKHPIVHSFEQMAERVDATYDALAERLGAQLAPVGAAFERAVGSDPELLLWGPDGSHPTLAGSFLAACVLYGTIAATDPRESSYVPLGMSPSRAELIKALAAETLAARRAAPPEDPVAPPMCSEPSTP